MSSTAGVGTASRGVVGKRRRLVRNASILTVVSLLLCEVVVRVLTTVGENGMQRIGPFVLLPYRPTAPMVAAARASDAKAVYLVPDRELGWTMGADAGSDGYRVNAQGIRTSSGRDYPTEIPDGKVRIVAVGDSFTHGDEVPNEATWAHVLQTVEPRLETLNLGVPGYGTDQAFLRWRRDGKRFRSDIVLLGIWPENVTRNVNLVRFYLVPQGMYSAKPRFVLDGGRLQLLNSPVVTDDELAASLAEPEGAAWLANDAWYSAAETQWHAYQGSRLLRLAGTLLNMSSRRSRRQDIFEGRERGPLDLTVAIARQFRDEVAATGATPLVLLVPARELMDMHRVENGLPLVTALRAAGLEVLDLGPPLAAAIDRGASDVYLRSGHLSEAGNRLFAQLLAVALAPHVAARRSVK